MTEAREHISVLLDQVTENLQPHTDGYYIDGTLGAGGHAEKLLEASMPNGQLLGLDADPAALAIAARNLERFGPRARFVHSNFENLQAVALANGFSPCDGIILDLGLSSMQLGDAARGFSFTGEGALDMRFNPADETSAADLLNTLDESEIADLIYEYGEEHASRRIARAIVYARPIGTAQQLAAVIERAIGRHGRIHPATRTFQALRIAVNRELEVLDRVLPQIVETLKPGGQVAIISFHSLEDRRIKIFFRSTEGLRTLTKHPVRPSYDQVRANPRCRSAKLRVAERVG